MALAVVYGGGGATGMAWQISLLASLQDHSLDLTGAETHIGTSAGSVVAARQACGSGLEVLLDNVRRPSHAGRGSPAKIALSTRLKLMQAGFRATDQTVICCRLAAMSLSRSGVEQDARRQDLQTRLEGTDWPRAEKALMVAAVSVDSGRVKAFDRKDDVSLIDAVTASCALPGQWPPVELLGELWMDGAAWSITNSQLAAGHDKVVIIAPVARWIRGTPSAQTQAIELRAQGSEVLLLTPGLEASVAVMRSVLYAGPKARFSAADAARRDARRVAKRLEAFLLA